MDDAIIILNKAFSLVFIFAITVINLWLIGNFLYWKNVFSKDKKCIITSLALSDLVIGLFCLSVEASLYFEIYLGGPGCALSHVEIYSKFFCPFVYGIGISILAVELIVREKGRTFYHQNKIFTVIVSSLPWLFAVVIVLPLIFIGSNTKACWYMPSNVQGICIWVISTLVPIIIMLGIWAVTAIVKWNDTSTLYHIPSATYSTCKSSSKDSTQGGPTSQALLMEGEGAATDHTQRNLEMETSLDTENSSNPHPINLGQSRETTSNPSSLQVDGSQQLITYASSTAPNLRTEDQVPNVENKQVKNGREKLHLLLIILIYVILTVPFSLYNLMMLVSSVYGSGSIMSNEAYFILKWMQTSRSLFIPVAWSLIFHLEKSRSTSF